MKKRVVLLTVLASMGTAHAESGISCYYESRRADSTLDRTVSIDINSPEAQFNYTEIFFPHAGWPNPFFLKGAIQKGTDELRLYDSQDQELLGRLELEGRILEEGGVFRFIGSNGEKFELDCQPNPTGT